MDNLIAVVLLQIQIPCCSQKFSWNALFINLGVRSSCTMMQAAVQPMGRKGKGALGARCDFIGSPTNLVSWGK